MFAGAIFFTLIPLLVLGAVLLVGAAIGGRKEADPEGRRPHAVYLSTVNLVALFTLVIAAGGLASSIASLIVGEGSSDNCVETPTGVVCSATSPGFEDPLAPESSDKAARGNAIQSGLLLAGALAILRFYWRPAMESADASAIGLRIHGVSLHIISFVSLLALVGSAVVAVYGLVQVAIPDFLTDGSTSSERDDGIQALITAAVVGVLSLVIFRWHAARATKVRDRLAGRQVEASDGG
jgi:hypothetical protein